MIFKGSYFACLLIFTIIFIIEFNASVYALPLPPAPSLPSPTLEWSHTYGGPLFDEGRTVLQTLDNGYIIAGTTSSLSKDGLFKAFILKTDENGSLQWIKTYGDDGNNTIGFSIVKTSDGGYALAGKSWPGDNKNSGEDVFLVKVDASGNSEWKKFYGGLKNDSGQCIVQSSDGGYAIFGYTESYGNGGMDAYLVKTDADGNLLWNKTYGSKKDDAGYFILNTAEGGYAMTGRIMSDATSSQSNHFIYLIKTDTNGTILTETGYTDPDSTICYCILNGSYSVLANVIFNDSYYIAITEGNGGKQVGYRFAMFGGNGDTIGYSLIPSENGTIAAGYTESFGNGKKDVYLLKNWDYMPGMTQWQIACGGDKDDIGYSIAPTSDGGWIAVGSTDSFGYGDKDVYLIKIKPNQTSPQIRERYPEHTIIKDNPQSTNLIDFLLSPAPSMQGKGAKPTPSHIYAAIPVIYIIIALVEKKKLS